MFASVNLAPWYKASCPLSNLSTIAAVKRNGGNGPTAEVVLRQQSVREETAYRSSIDAQITPENMAPQIRKIAIGLPRHALKRAR